MTGRAASGGGSTWFMPALTKRRLGSPRGRTGAEGRRRWPWRSWKKRRKAARTCSAGGQPAAPRRGPQRQSAACSSRRRPAAAMLAEGGKQRRQLPEGAGRSGVVGGSDGTAKDPHGTGC